MPGRRAKAASSDDGEGAFPPVPKGMVRVMLGVPLGRIPQPGTAVRVWAHYKWVEDTTFVAFGVGARKILGEAPFLNPDGPPLDFAGQHATTTFSELSLMAQRAQENPSGAPIPPGYRMPDIGVWGHFYVPEAKLDDFRAAIRATN